MIELARQYRRYGLNLLLRGVLEVLGFRRAAWLRSSSAELRLTWPTR